MALIKIQRTNEYNNRLRDFKIFIDGLQVGKIANGETKTFTTSAGEHHVVAKIDWCSSPMVLVHIGDNETKTLKVGSFKNGNWILPVAVGLILFSGILVKTAKINFAIYLLVPFLLLMGYYLTLGRKKYLSLTRLD